MAKSRYILSLVAVAALAMMVGPSVSDTSARRHRPHPHDEGEILEFSKAEIFFEFNSTDKDLGLHLFFDADAWEEVEVTGPDGTIFEVENDEGLNEIGSTEVFTESAEPPLDEDNLAEDMAAFFAKFPEGEYVFEGETIEGDTLIGTAVLTHELPNAPVIDAENYPTIEWSVPGGGAEVVLYEALLEVVAEEDGEELVFVHRVEFPAGIKSMTVGPEFVALVEAYEAAEMLVEMKAEVIAEEAGGNRTITEEVLFELEEEE